MIDLKNFTATAEYKQTLKEPIIISLPKKGRAFRVSDLMQKDLWVIRHRERWHLVNPELAESGVLEGVTLADLHLAVYDDGTPFIIPNTIGEGKKISWYNSMLDIIESAKVKWMMLEATKNFKHQAAPSDYTGKMSRFLDSFENYVNNGFNGRIVYKVSDLKNTVSQDFEEE